MGIFALAYAASAVLTALRSFGVGNYLIREPDLHREGPFRLRRHVADLLGSGTRAVSRPARHRGPLWAPQHRRGDEPAGPQLRHRAFRRAGERASDTADALPQPAQHRPDLDPGGDVGQ